MLTARGADGACGVCPLKADALGYIDNVCFRTNIIEAPSSFSSSFYSFLSAATLSVCTWPKASVWVATGASRPPDIRWPNASERGRQIAKTAFPHTKPAGFFSVAHPHNTSQFREGGRVLVPEYVGTGAGVIDWGTGDLRPVVITVKQGIPGMPNYSMKIRNTDTVHCINSLVH